MDQVMRKFDVTPQRGLPVDDTGNSSTIISVSAETVQLYYYNSGVLTVDAGQVAGVVVVGQLAYENIKNTLGSSAGIYGDTSLSFTAGALTTEVDYAPGLGSLDDLSGSSRAAKIGATLSNGQYVVDYNSGTIYGKKTTNATTLAAAAYKIHQGVVASSALVTPNINVKQVGGEAVVADNGTGTGVTMTVPVGGRYRATYPTYGDNDVVMENFDVRGNLKVAEISNLVKVAYDYVGVTWSGVTFNEVFTFKSGGAGGTTVATVTLVYVSATKAQLVSVTLS